MPRVLPHFDPLSKISLDTTIGSRVHRTVIEMSSSLALVRTDTRRQLTDLDDKLLARC